MVALAAFLAVSLFAAKAMDFDNEAGFAYGCGNPFGLGALEFWRHLNPTHELGTGIGVSLAGTNFGVGYKRYFREENRWNPWIGLSGFYATGRDSAPVIVPRLTVSTYRMKPGFALQPRVGIRYQAGWLNLHFATGWGFPVIGGGAEFQETNLGLRSDKAAEFYALGGPELSIAAMLRL